MGKKRTRPTTRSTIDKKRIREKPKSKKERIGQPTGLFDCEGKEIMTGDFVRLRGAGYSGPVMWHNAWRCYRIFMGLWYGDQDPYNPICYGKCIEIPADNGMRMSIERVKQKGRQR